jgi:dihydrofolate synthase/folylpolyglutamate synthase
MNYQQSLDYINNLTVTQGSELRLDKLINLLTRLNNPQNNLNFIHVAGTNGKGSVCAYITEILTTAGYVIGRYISPTVFDYREKIQIISNNTVQYITEQSVSTYLTKIKTICETMLQEGLEHPSSFEIETAMAFLEFTAMNCDIVVLEVGMGGRLDATNVIPTALCAVFTSISMDHMSMLGNTVEQIAKEKAGIIKEGIDIVSYEQPQNVIQIIENEAKDKHAKLFVVDFTNINDIQYNINETTFTYESNRINKMKYTITLLGEHQPRNAVTAIETIITLRNKGYNKITNDNIIKGIHNTTWKGRFDIIYNEPLIIVDGAHNYDAALSLRKSLDVYFKDKQVIMIVGIFADKEYEKILAVTLDKAKEVYVIEPKNKRALCSAVLTNIAKKYCDNVNDVKDINKGLDMVINNANKDDVIICFGSLSFLHEVYAYVKLL